MHNVQIYRSAIYHCLHDPGAEATHKQAVEYYPDGLLIVENGRVARLGPAAAQLPQLPADIAVTEFSDKLIVPGFIDSHTHYPQTDIIAAYGKQLLDWLNDYTFPQEKKFADAAYAREVADFFIQQLFRHGTTTAVVMPTVHPQSVEAIFSAACERNMCLISGKLMMDRHAPEYLLDTPETSYAESKKLLEKWHKQGRLHYAISPRFAPTSTDAQLAQAGLLARQYPDVYIHTHLAENKKEVAWVTRLFPQSRSYLDVYDQYDLLRERSLFAHGIYLSDADLQRLHDSKASIVFCPTSNLFLGSGLLDLQRLRDYGVSTALGTDVGAGTSFSMLQTLNEAYKVQQLAGNSLSAHQGFYLATLGSARALKLDHEVGNFERGKAADFTVLDYQATPLIQRRLQAASNIEEILFTLMMLGDDRVVAATYVMGECVYSAHSTLCN